MKHANTAESFSQPPPSLSLFSLRADLEYLANNYASISEAEKEMISELVVEIKANREEEEQNSPSFAPRDKTARKTAATQGSIYRAVIRMADQEEHELATACAGYDVTSHTVLEWQTTVHEALKQTSLILLKTLAVVFANVVMAALLVLVVLKCLDGLTVTDSAVSVWTRKLHRGRSSFGELRRRIRG